MRVQLDECAVVPTRAHMTDAGIDICAQTNAYVVIRPGESHVFDTGVHVELPPGTAGLLVSKSGLNVKHGITSEGLIDEGYTGPIKVKLYNHGEDLVVIKGGQKISQLVVIPVKYEPIVLCDHIDGGERGDNGFGSTGK